MAIEFGLTDELCNTQYAPLAALCAHFQHNQVLKPLETVQIQQKKRDFSPPEKLIQVFLSVLAGCRTLSEVKSGWIQKAVWQLYGAGRAWPTPRACPGPWTC